MSVLTFEYTGDEVSRQHRCSGDDVYERRRARQRNDALVEFGATGGRKQIERRPCCRVYVIKNRAAPAASQKTSRSSAGMAGIGSFFGGSASSLAAVDITPKQRAPRGGAFKSLPRGGGSRGGGSSLGAAALEAAAVVAADAKGNHPQARKAQRPRKMPGLLASGRRRVRRARRAKQARRAAAGAGQQLALFTIGAEHAELKQEDGGSSQPSKEAKAGDINVDTMSAMEHETES